MKTTTILLFNLFIALFTNAQEKYFVANPTLNMRDEPNKEGELIGTLSQGSEVVVIEKKSNGWWLVNCNGKIGFIYSNYLQKEKNLQTSQGSYSSWDKKNYSTGSTPECENVQPKYDFGIDNYLRIIVGSHTDVVIKLMKMKSYSYESDVCVRIVYVRSGDTYEIKNIPEGKYYLKNAYGKDWRQNITDGNCYGKFIINPMYEKGTDILDYNITNLSDRDLIPSFQLSLDVISTSFDSDNFNGNNISEEEFNK